MTADIALSHRAAHWAAGIPALQGMSRACAVRLIERRTGAAHRINGTPLTLFTRRPHEAAAELLAGRDASVWEVRVDPLEPEERQ